MDLFTIQCTTCNARLVVRDASVIGDILACPKCGSMVQIVPPPDWKRPDSSNISPGELTVTGSSTVASPKTPQSPAPSKKKAAAVIPPALPVRKPLPEPMAPQSASPQPAPASVASSQPVATTAAPLADPADVAAAPTPPLSPSISAATTTPALAATFLNRSRQDWLVLGGGLTAGVLLGTVAWFVMWMRTAPPAIVAKSNPVTVAPAAPPAANEAKSEPTEPAAASLAAEPSPANAVATTEPSPAPTAETPLIENSPSQEQPVASEPVAAAVAAPAEPPVSKATPALKLEPIAGGTPLAPGEVVPSDKQPTESAATTPLEPLGKTDDAQASDPVVPHDDLLDHGSPGEPEPMTAAQIEQRLGVSLARVEFANVTLAQFAAFIGDMTGVPVVLDEISLTDAGKSRKTPIAVRLSNTTALAALRAAGKQAGLTYAIEDGQIVISAARP